MNNTSHYMQIEIYQGQSRISSSGVHYTWITWGLIFPLSNFDHDWREPSRDVAHILFVCAWANFVGTKWCVLNDKVTKWNDFDHDQVQNIEIRLIAMFSTSVTHAVSSCILTNIHWYPFLVWLINLKRKKIGFEEKSWWKVVQPVCCFKSIYLSVARSLSLGKLYRHCLQVPQQHWNFLNPAHSQPDNQTHSAWVFTLSTEL